jgi:hypothetical protein
MIFNAYTCQICGGKKGRGFDHSRCSEQAKQITRKRSKSKKMIRESDITYLIKSTEAK